MSKQCFITEMFFIFKRFHRSISMIWSEINYSNCSIITNVLSEMHIVHSAGSLGLMGEGTWTALRAIMASRVDENEIGICHACNYYKY